VISDEVGKKAILKRKRLLENMIIGYQFWQRPSLAVPDIFNVVVRLKRQGVQARYGLSYRLVFAFAILHPCQIKTWPNKSDTNLDRALSVEKEGKACEAGILRVW
jgi:hypothetical protein